RFQQSYLFRRHLVAHQEDAAIAALRRDDGQADAGIAARRFDDDTPRLQEAISFGGVDHRECGPVLRTPARVHRLKFHQHLNTLRCRQSIEPNERRFANEVKQGVRYAHGSTLFGRELVSWRPRRSPQVSPARAGVVSIKTPLALLRRTRHSMKPMLIQPTMMTSQKVRSRWTSTTASAGTFF